MFLEIEIKERRRRRDKKSAILELAEGEDNVRMRFDKRPEFEIPELRILKRTPRLKRKTDGSASFLRAARAGNLEKVLEFLKTNTDINTCNANGLNALHLASKEGHVNVVRELLQRGANVDAATKKGNTALHIASLAGQEEIVKVLVQHQALVNIQSQNGFTPLYMAAQENHDSVVRFLLANNANQSLATEDGFTPLAVALQQGHDKVVAVLLENDTRGKVRLPALHIAAKKDDTKAAALLLHTDHNPDVTSKSGFTPLHIAAHYGNENIANLLIQRGADVNYIAKHQITPLHVASKWGKGNMVSLLIDKGANYEAKTRDGLTPLHCAARSGHETVVDMLLEKGAPITSKTKNGLAPLHMSSQGDHVDAARILLYHKAPVDDVTVDFLTALHVAAHCGHVRVAKLLLDRKADPNSRALNGFTPLHIACKKNRIKVVELLLKHGASIEATTESGLTPLHVASFMGCMNIVIYLIQHGASADVPTVRGETPLHLAARANQTDIIRILLRNGAQVDARAREQQTALHIASRLGNSDIVVLLLQHGAAVDATTKDHYTALHIAAKEGQEEVASVLLEHGASLASTTKKGFTPLHLAAKYGNMKVARLLLQKDAPVDAQGKNGVTPLHVAAHYDHQNVALLLLDKGASPHATAKNGYTPLHIAARKNQMDIATTLLEYGASSNAESKAGFTPLHLSSQEGHTDMATLLIEHNAAPGACAKNGLTPLHLCAQEDRVNVAAILVKHGAQIDPSTKAGYTPLHVACHFGQMNMVRFLLQHGVKVDSTTQLGYTPLHQAAQQGHTQIVNLLLENKAEPNTETNDGKTALSIAQRLGYISVVETLKVVTETTINTTTTTVTEEKYKVVVPETMHETFMSESEDEGGDDTMLGDQSYRYLTVDEMKSLGDDSLPIDVTKDEKMDISFISNSMAAPPVAPADQLSPQHQKEQQYAQFTGHYPSDNVDVAKTTILAGPESLSTTLNTTIDSAMIESQIESQIIQTKLAPQLSAQMAQESVQHPPVQQILVHNDTDQASKGQVTSGQVTSVTEKSPESLNGWEGFLVSFMVDARGGAMRGCRHSGVRVIIPPRKAAMPMRVTCRYLKKDKLVHAPPLMEGEALASRILEMGPAGAKFLGPVIIEVPHFASLRGKEREIVILRSDNGETWREHTLEATEEAVQEVLNESFDGEELKQLEDLNTNRITRILTTDFPQYFAIVTRIRQEVHAIGPEGGMVSSTVVPQVQAVFPQGALTKKIKVGLQAQPIPTDLVAKLLGNRVAVSPIVTVEPRRRKFHKPITLTIPVPQASSKGMINQYSGEAPTLRLLCSITGGTTRAQWEDVTGSTPLTFVNDCVSFTTTVSARFWLMDCSNIPEATKMATELYREAIHVPFMAKFVVFSKRHQLEEARVRVFCMTDDREDKTLEHQELFVEVAKSRDVEVLEGKPQFLEFAGNLVPVTKSGDQLAFNFYAFRENRLPFTVRVKDQHADPIGRVAFMRQPKVGRGDPPQTPICNLNIALPDNIQPEPAPSEPDLLALEKKYSFLSISKADTIHKADLRLTDISNMLGTDWVALAHELEISDSDINIIKSQYPDNAPQQAIVMLRLWMQTSGNKANGNTLEKGLRKIGRDDIVNQCIFNVELVTDDIERAMAKAHLDQSGFEAFRDELGPSRDATLNRDVSLDVSYDEQDMMKEAESAEEEEENQRAYQEKSSREQRTVDMSPTYESEEKKYAGEEKIVTEEKVTKDVTKDSSSITISTTSAAVIKEPTEKSKLEMVIKETTVSEPVQETKIESIIKEQVVSEPIKEMKVDSSFTEPVVSEPIEETITTAAEEVILREEPLDLLENNKIHFTVAEAEEKVIEKDEQVVEQEALEKPIVKVVEKPVKVEEKILVMKEVSEVPKDILAPETEDQQKIQTTVTTEIISGPEGILTPVTTTKRESYTTSEDGTVQEHIVVTKQITKTVVDGLPMEEEDKSIILQKLGEELGRLDEKLEEKFKEKRKADEPEVAQEEVIEEAVVAMRREGHAQPTSQIVVEHGSLPSTLSVTTTTTTTTSRIAPIPDGFTQTSVELSQMSSTRGTAEVSFPATTTTTDDIVMQMGQALTQQAALRLVDRRVVHDDPLQQDVLQLVDKRVVHDDPLQQEVSQLVDRRVVHDEPLQQEVLQLLDRRVVHDKPLQQEVSQLVDRRVIHDDSVQEVSQLVERRITHDDSLQEEVSQQHFTDKQQPLDNTAVVSDSSAKSGRTEERGCSPITVLEARPEMNQMKVRPLSRGSSHTITTTTSWGAPVSTTTNIQLCDNESAHCVQLTLHSESCVTLHAPEEIWEELRHVRQQPTPQEQQPTPQEQQPMPKEQQPTPQEQQPVPKEQQPTPQEQKPTPQEQQPTPQKQQPTPQEQQPTPQEQQPTSQEQQPTSQEQQPTPQEPQSTMQKQQTTLQEQEPIPQEQQQLQQQQPTPHEQQQLQQQQPTPQEQQQQQKQQSSLQEQQQQQQDQESSQIVSNVEMESKLTEETVAVITKSKKLNKKRDLQVEEHYENDSEKDVEERTDTVDDCNIEQSLSDHKLVESVATLDEPITEDHHKSQDPSKKVFSDTFEQTTVVTCDELVKSIQKHLSKEIDISGKYRGKEFEELSTLSESISPVTEVEDLIYKEKVSREVAVLSDEAVDKDIILLSAEDSVAALTQALLRNIELSEYEDPAALSEKLLYAANEVIAPSAHRPTTLMITSNSNESTDDAECMANDPTRDGRENDIPQDLKQEGSSTAVMEESEQQEMQMVQSTVMNERLSGSESGAVPRTERSVRSAPRTTTLVKVKVEKRPVGSHPQARERIAHEHQTVVHAPSVEEEMRGLMQEVKEATSQIKQEVKELRQADTPTPDTPTPLREFKEFLNREEEQEQERLPTIKEICRESEEDAFVNTGGEHAYENEQFKLRLSVPIQEQIVQPDIDDIVHPNSEDSTVEGYYAVSVNPSQAAKYTPFSAIVPEEYSDECNIKSKPESPSTPVDNFDSFPVVSIGSDMSSNSKEQSKSKLKSFFKKVRKLTSKGLHKPESGTLDDLGENLLDRNREIPSIANYKSEIWERSGIKTNVDEVKSPFYESISTIIQPETLEEKYDRYEEDQCRIGEQKQNESSVINLKVPIEDPIKEITISSLTGSIVTEIIDTHPAVSKSLVSKEVDTDCNISEFPFSEACHSHSALEWPLTEQPLTLSPALEFSDSDVPHISNVSHTAEVPHTTEAPHTGMVSHTAEASHTTEVPYTSKVSHITEAPHTAEVEVPHTTEVPYTSEFPELQLTKDEIHYTGTPKFDFSHTEIHYIRSSEVASPITVGNFSVPELESNELDYTDSSLSDFPSGQASLHIEVPCTEALVSGLTLSVVPLPVCSASELSDTKVPLVESSVSDSPPTTVSHILHSVSDTKMPLTKSSLSESPHTEVPHTFCSLSDNKVPHIDPSASELPHTEVPLIMCPASDTKVPPVESLILELPYTEVPLTEHSVLEFAYTEVPLTESIVPELLHTEMSDTKSSTSEIHCTEVLYSELQMPDLTGAMVSLVDSSLSAVSHTEVAVVEPCDSTEPLLTDISAIAPLNENSSVTLSADRKLECVSVLYKLKKNGSRAMVSHSAGDINVGLPFEKMEENDNLAFKNVEKHFGKDNDNVTNTSIGTEIKENDIKQAVNFQMMESIRPDLHTTEIPVLQSQSTVKTEQCPQVLTSDKIFDIKSEHNINVGNGHLEVPKDVWVGEGSRESLFSEESIQFPSLVELAEFCPSSTVYEDDDEYIEFPNSDVVEILETVFELDETEDIDDCSHNVKGTEYFEKQEIGTQYQMERSSELHFTIDDMSDIYDTHNDEIQLLSEADIKAMDESSSFLEKPRNETQLLNEIECTPLVQSFGLQENIETRAAMMMDINTKGNKDEFDETKSSNLKFDRTEHVLHLSHSPDILCKDDKFIQKDERCIDDYIKSGKIIQEDIPLSDTVLHKRILDPNEEIGLDSGEKFKVEESKDFDDSLTEDVLSPKPVDKKAEKQKDHTFEAFDEVSVSQVTPKQEEQSDLVAGVPSSPVTQEFLLKLSHMKEDVMIPEATEYETAFPILIMETTDESSQNKLKMNEQITEIENMQQTNLSVVKRGLKYEPEENSSVLKSSAEKLISDVSEVKEVKELHIAVLNEPYIKHLHNIHVVEADEAFETEEIEELPSFESTLVSKLDQAYAVTELEQLSSPSTEQVVVNEAHYEVLNDVLDTNDGSQREFIKSEDSQIDVASKFSEMDDSVLRPSDIQEGQGYMMPMIKDIYNTLREGDSKELPVSKNIEVLLSGDSKRLFTPESLLTRDSTEAKTIPPDTKENFSEGIKAEAVIAESKLTQLQSTLGSTEKEQSLELDIKGNEPDNKEENYCKSVIPVVGKYLFKDILMANAVSDLDTVESTLDVMECVDTSQVRKPLSSEEQISHYECEYSASDKAEESLFGMDNTYSQKDNGEEVSVTDDIITEDFDNVQEAQVNVSYQKLGSTVKDANIPLNLQTKIGLHHNAKLVRPTVSEDAQVNECSIIIPIELRKYDLDTKQLSNKNINYGRLESESETKPSEHFEDATELVKPPELSSTEVEVSEHLIEDVIDSTLISPCKNENVSVLNSVSEELKTIIFTLEQNLIAGTNTDISITPILARLEQMEQEVVNLDSISKAPESSIPVLLHDIQIDDVVSTSQASSSTQKELETHREKLNFEDFSYSKVTMPVGLSTEASTLALPHGQSPSREINGQDIKESLTDVEDLFSDGDQTPMLKRKALNLTLQKDAETVTDTEDTDLSGEEDDIIKEESNIPTIQDLGLLPEPNKEVINLTEGYARGASPILHSDSEPESEDVQGKHMKNILRVDKMNQLDLPSDDVAEALTDVEDMVASGDEEEVVEAEDSLPEHYMDQSEGVSDREKLKASSPAPKIFLAESEDLSDDDKKALKHNRHKSKVILEVNPQEGGTTDVEDLVLSDKEGKEKPECGKNKKEKIRRKKQIRRKTVPKKTIAAKSLIVLTGDSSGLTDVEILSGDEDEGVVEDEDLGLIVPEIDIGILTDSEDVEVSDTEDVADLMPKPVDKVEISLIPDPHSERVKISEIEEAAQEESGGETEEEGFELNEKDDEKALNPRQTVLHEPIVIVGKETLDADEETYEAALTDTEDLGIDEHEEEELLAHITNRLPEEGDIYTITEMESCSGQITKKEIMKDCQAKQIEDAELTGFFLQEDFEDNAHTDVEDLDDSGEYGKNEVKTIPEAKTKVEDGLTDEESVDESDIEEEIQEPPKQVRKRNKRLPLVPQVSEVRFVETEQGPLSIIITPDTIEKHLDQIMKDQVTNVVFLESEDKEEAITDIEDLSDGEEGKTILNLKLPQNKQEPTTDTEDFDIDPCEMNRPLSPVPPNIKYNVLPSPKRELIQIKEDKYGVPQVTVRKLEKDELFVSDIEDLGATDIEDLDVSEDEALRLVGITEDSTSDFEFPDAGTTEVSTKMIHKIQSVHVEVEEGGGTDIEELPTTRKPRRKAKSHSKLMPKEQGEDSHTDIELLSDQDDKGKLTVRLENPGGNTDVEDFEASETEEVEVPDREDMPTPDIIRDAAIKKMIILKEGPDGTTYTEDAHVAEDPVNFLGVEGEAGGITDVEDMEVSGAEDEIITDHPAVDLPEYEASSVDISETTSLPSDSNEAKHIKDNLLLPEDNFNNLTDVESLGEGEGNRCASNTHLLSGQQLTHAVESCSVDELPYPSLLFADPKLCIHPGLSLESDPFCGELTNPLVVEAELEQVYYHAPQEQPKETELELEAHNGCVIRRRQVVASTCQAREIRRFWAQDRNSPLHQSEMSTYASPVTHKRGFKTILYLEQPDLLDAISISDTLCDSYYFKNERFLEFDSSSIASSNDYFPYRESDIVSVVDHFSQERSSSLDDLPSPHLSSIGGSIVDSLYSVKSFSTDTHIHRPLCSSPLSNTLCNRPLCSSPLSNTAYNRGSGDNHTWTQESQLWLRGNSTSICSFSPEITQQQITKVEPSEKNISDELHFETETDCGLYFESTKKNNTGVSLTQASCQHFSTSKLPAEVSTTQTEKPIYSEMEKDCAGIHRYSAHRSASYQNIIGLDTPIDCIKGKDTIYEENSFIKSLPKYLRKSSKCLGETSDTAIYEEYMLKEEQEGKKEERVPAEFSLSQEKDAIRRLNFEFYKEYIPQSLETSPVDFQNNFLLTCAFDSDVKCIDSKLTADVNSLTEENNESTTTISNDNPPVSFESDSGVHAHTSEGFTASFDSTNVETTAEDYGSDTISLADSALSLEERVALCTHNYSYHDGFSPTSSHKQILPIGMLPTCSQIYNLDLMQKSASGYKNYTDLVVSESASKSPLHWRHTLPRMCRQLRDSTKLSSPKVLNNTNNNDNQEIVRDFVGVKGLIEQWEEIVGKRRRSLPSSPAVTRKIFPPFEGKAQSVRIFETEGRKLAELELRKNTVEVTLNQSHKSMKDTENVTGDKGIEEIASVCDIIHQFEGRVGQVDKITTHRPRLHRGAHSPASRTPSHLHQVAAVKPLCQPQLQLKHTGAAEEVQHLEHNKESMDNPLMAGFVPRVMEFFPITKTSREGWEEDPALAYVLNPEGTHEAGQLVDRQIPPHSHEQGLGVEEMSSMMESYTSDGSDPITTTHITRYDPDPLTTTTTTHTTRIIRRTLEDGEVKEEVYEEY